MRTIVYRGRAMEEFFFRMSSLEGQYHRSDEEAHRAISTDGDKLATVMKSRSRCIRVGEYTVGRGEGGSG